MNRYADLGASNRHDHGLFSPAELYHENSKMRRAADGSLIASYDPTPAPAELQYALLHTMKTYRTVPNIPLPHDLPPLDVSLATALQLRASVREYSGVSFPLAQLSQVLLLSYGISGAVPLDDGAITRPRRVTPSGGALYPIELYVVVLRVTDLAPGLYHYQPADHSLELLRAGSLQREIEAAILYPEVVAQANVVMLMGAVFHRHRFKYGERGYRFTLFDAGHIGQNVHLVATALGLGAVLIGGYVDDAIDRLVEMNGVDESVISIMILGNPAEADVTQPLDTSEGGLV